jgi:hypothetical protein
MNRSSPILVTGECGDRTERKCHREQRAHDSTWQFRNKVHHGNIA